MTYRDLQNPGKPDVFGMYVAQASHTSTEWKEGVANVKLAFTIVRGRGGSAEAQPSHCGAFPGVTSTPSSSGGWRPSCKVIQGLTRILRYTIRIRLAKVLGSAYIVFDMQVHVSKIPQGLRITPRKRRV